MIQQVDIGDVVELEAVAEKRDGSPASPADYYFKVQPPDGEAVKLSATAGDDGGITATYEPTEAGSHDFLFIAKSGDKVAGEGRFKVKKPRVARD